MRVKRPHGRDAKSSVKKQKGRFAIGPAHLPDGTHRRKIEKIKKGLISKAKLKKQYAKLKAREESEATTPRKSVYDRESAHDDDGDEDEDEDKNEEPTESAPEPTLEPHPDRVAMLEEKSPVPEPRQNFERRQRPSRPQPFLKETEVAQKKKEEIEARQRAREEADKGRAKKIAERERFRKTMAKARGPNGQRKLGRENTVLLAKAQRLMGKT